MSSPASAPRIAPGGRRDVGVVAWLISRVSARVAGTETPKLFLTLGRHRRLFLAWAHFGGRLMPGGRLPRRETEMVILRVAHLRSCDYELHHHRRLAARSGLDAAGVARTAEGPAAPGWTERERTLLEAVDELHATQDLTDETWAKLSHHLDERERLELVFLVGHYEMLATAIGTLRIAPDEDRPRRRR